MTLDALPSDLPRTVIAIALLVTPTIGYVLWRLLRGRSGRQEEVAQVGNAEFWICQNCSSLNPLGHSRCYHCRQKAVSKPWTAPQPSPAGVGVMADHARRIPSAADVAAAKLGPARVRITPDARPEPAVPGRAIVRSGVATQARLASAEASDVPSGWAPVPPSRPPVRAPIRAIVVGDTLQNPKPKPKRTRTPKATTPKPAENPTSLADTGLPTRVVRRRTPRTDGAA